jgi:hypothetical protein
MARQLGAHRGRLVAVWLTGSEAGGPYTLVAMSIQQGKRDDVVHDINKRAARRGYATNPDGLAPTTAATHSKPILKLVTYNPGDRFESDRVVLAGTTGVVMTLTMPRPGSGSRSLPAVFSLVRSGPSR